MKYTNVVRICYQPSRSNLKKDSKEEDRLKSQKHKSFEEFNSRTNQNPVAPMDTNRFDKELQALEENIERYQVKHEKQQKILRNHARELKWLHEKIKTELSLVHQIENSESQRKDQSTKESQSLTPNLTETRELLPSLRNGEEVLARWCDDGWYYRGIVKKNCGDFNYLVEDVTKTYDKICREDIITDYDNTNQTFTIKDPVVALHPHFKFSYSPGTVLEVYRNFFVKIRFYDGEECTLPRNEIYRSTRQKYEHDVNYIIKCEIRWIGQAVVARDDKTGIYQLGTVKNRLGSGREYTIVWCDGQKAVQRSIHIFGSFTKHRQLFIGDRVLAKADKRQNIYLPGCVAGIVGDRINVKFCNGLIRDIEDILHCFWISTDYYDNAVKFYKKFNSD